MSAQGDVKTLHAAPFSFPPALECPPKGFHLPQIQVFAPQRLLTTAATSCQQGNMSYIVSTHICPLNSFVLVMELIAN